MEEETIETEPKPSTSKRTWTMRNNAARQVAVNFMPSRQLPCNTIRLRRTNSERSALLELSEEIQNGSEDQAEIIVREMTQHHLLMENNPQSEEMRREALRDLPEGLTMKRTVRAKLSASVSLRSQHKPISMYNRLKYRLGFALKISRNRVRDHLTSVELWYASIRKIEGHFGSAVASYFYFLRWLFLMNFGLLIFVLCFVVIPQVLYDSANNAQGFNHGDGIMDFLTGKGMFEDTVLFYGHYHSERNATVVGGTMNYNMTFAYFYTMLTLYLFIFFLLCYRTADSYRRNFISFASGLGPVFSAKVFSGWDHSIATSHAATLNARSIYNEFKELLNEQTKNNEPSTCCLRFGQKLVNVFVTCIVLTLITGIDIGVWYLLSVDRYGYGFWSVTVSAGFTAVVSICPLLFSLVSRLEYYRPRTALYVTLCRTFFLDMSMLLILLFYWSRSNIECWETALGQKTYRLVLYDALISLIVLPIIEFTRGIIYKLYPMTSPPEFNLAYNSLTLIYNQGVLWLGMVFSPLLVVMVTAKMLLLFYVKMGTVFGACQPARKVWRASQTRTILFMLVNLSLFITLFALGSLFIRTTSAKCGPFIHYAYVYSVLSEGLLSISHHPNALAVILFVCRPGVIGFVLLLLCVWVYYTRARSLAQRSMVTMLRQMLVLERKDKDFLLAAIAKVSNGEWLYKPKPEELNNTHTWKYLHDSNIRKPSNAGFHLDASRLTHSMADRPVSCVSAREVNDGDTDSSFSWKDESQLQEEDDGGKKWL